MAVLMIGATEREKIAQIIERAKRRPVLFEQVRQGIADDTDVLRLQDRKPGFVRPPSAHVSFPGGYRAAFSIEEQPPGMCSHLSVSVEGRSKPGMMPSPEAVAAIAEEFGVPFPPNKSWVEEYAPGEYAINLVSLITPREEGHA
jgi:hypothetical protein